ncbi:O-antigen ligase family protein, partial [Peribacillus frigoritolerans]|uniref:O-antigen ligase family protein n=1 Tax=Peribacillus frigoritolerans TaxID=450367 RepID=UPI003626B769
VYIIGLSIIIGLFSAIQPILALFCGCMLIFLIITCLKPLQTLVVIISIWSVVQGFLSSIYIIGLPASQLFIPLLLLLTTLAILVRKKVDNRFLGLSFSYMILVSWSVLGLAYTKFLEDAVTSYARLVVGWLLFHYLITTISDRKRNNSVADIIIIGGSISGLLTVIEYLLYTIAGIQSINGFEIVTEYYGNVFRPSGGFGGPVASAVSLYAIYIISAYRYTETKSKLYIVTTLLIVAGICCTLTRTVIITLILTFIFQAIYLSYIKRSIKPLAYTFSLLTVMVLTIFIFARDIIEGRLVDFVDATSVETYGGGRFGIWLSIIEGLKQEGTIVNSFIGYGISISRYFVYKYSNFGLEDYTHNDYLDTYLANGIIGLVLLCYFILK